jgi:hypothetical protein
MKCFLVFVFVFFTASLAVEQETLSLVDGNDLLPRCQAAIASSERSAFKDVHESFSAGFCTGLVDGIIYSSSSVCPPDGVTALQSVRVVVKFLNDNPDKLNLDQRVLVDAALTKAFPCKHK